MEITIGKLKEIIKGLDDNIIVADLGYGNQNFKPFVSVKRMLLLEDSSGQKYITINALGSHFTAKGNQQGLSIVPCHEYVNDVLVFKCSTTCSGLNNCKLSIPTNPHKVTNEK